MTDVLFMSMVLTLLKENVIGVHIEYLYVQSLLDWKYAMLHATALKGWQCY